MAANIETMFSVRETPWHNQGIVIKEAPTSEEAIKIAQLDWDVVGNPIYDGDGNLIPGYKLNTRTSDNKALGVVTDKYRIVQNREAFAFTDELLGEGVTYETAGSLASGKRVWMLARLEGTKICGDDFENFLVFTNTHDGTSAIKVAITPVRVVCQNTLNLALSQASRTWSCIHKGDIQGKLSEAKITLSNAAVYQEQLTETLETMNEQNLYDSDLKDIIATILPYPVNKDGSISKRAQQNVDDLRAELLFRYESAPDLQKVNRSAYRFINAVSDFATHSAPRRLTTNFAENRFMQTVDGNAIIDKAYRLLAA